MFSLVLFSGLFTLTLSVPQYVFVNESKTWAEAQRYCRDKYTDLATTENNQQTVQLLDTVNDDSIDLAWIGLYDDLNNWKWTLEDSDFFNVGGKEFRNWYNRGPDNYAGQSLCMYMYYGTWYTTTCSNTFYPTLCYDGRQNASATYVLIYQYKNWTEAQSYCREHHTDLVSIRNETENQKIQYLLRNYYYYTVWIGLYKTRSWSDRSNSSFSYWSTWQPDTAGSCTVVSFSDSGKWADEYCNYAFPFFCHNASSRQYHFVNESKTWTEAQRYCRQNYTDLATIDNMEEMNRLINTVNGSYSGSAWIGQYDDVNSWRWSLENNDFYQEGERDFRNWYHEPDNNGGNQLCVYMSYDGKWYDMSCDNMLTFVCYDGRANATQRYIRIYNGKTWSEARRYCREHYTDLANVRNQTENQMIFQVSGGQVWIGLYRNRVWSNNKTTSYQNWRPQIPWSQAQPDNGNNQANEYGYQHCTAVSFQYSGRWTDEVCVSSMPFFCYSRTCTQSSCTRQYHFVNESKTWTEAQRYCRQNYTDLATIDNMEEMNRLFKTARGSYYGKAWIGLYDDLNSWRWSLEDAALEKGFKSWYIQTPVNSGGQSLCAYMRSYNWGTWSEISCSSTLPFVCYDGRANASSSYVFVYQSKTWTEAQSYCREHHTDLVSIRNEIENYRVQSLIPYYYTVWIGLYRTRSWSDQSNSSFSNWRTGQPDNAGNSEYCTAVSFNDSGNWTDENCNTAFPFICYSALASSHQYHFVNESKTWAEAQRYCRQNYTDLATIDNMEEMNSLINTVNGSYNGSAWIGLYDDVNSWRWSLEDNDFYQVEERDFRNWYQEPDNNAGNELCVSMDYNGNWYDSSCDNFNTFVCYDGRENASQKYIWVSTGRTWTEAQSYCREKYTDLASVRNETERQQILSIARYYYSYYHHGYYYNGYTVWIGLHRNRLWSDQSSSSFTYWLPYTQGDVAQPDNGANVPGQQGAQHCIAVSLKYFGQWTDERCLASLPFFCYSADDHHINTFSDEYVMGMRIEVTSLENLSESQIEKLVILQLQEELIGLGLPSNATMHLRDYRKIKP
ncbi:macrophage mannose receptor 1-like isoform X1 [Ctenopharyngodon idella]|uniref:macrophage mannose receptor 1-like isoform X1 n=1 Tax=Ctenopharyngodon idella TaxID=7959 RepID=UPI00223270EB|nr:macrophage mannose receptor 1-like isoform X1 [Ctenopharyngodon idella]XP_051733305.1 macrophage mannose receptor 1-like isoform X1 [Ctenopharyngodon idella]